MTIQQSRLHELAEVFSVNADDRIILDNPAWSDAQHIQQQNFLSGLAGNTVIGTVAQNLILSAPVDLNLQTTSGNINLTAAGTINLLSTVAVSEIQGPTTILGQVIIDHGPSGQAAVWGDANELIIEDDNDVGITLKSPANRYGTIAFADPGATNAGYIRYFHNLNHLEIRVAGAGSWFFNSDQSLSNQTAAWSIESVDALHLSPTGDLWLNPTGGASQVIVWKNVDLQNFRLRNPDSGATASRPGVPTLGERYWDTDLAEAVWYDGAEWTNNNRSSNVRLAAALSPGATSATLDRIPEWVISNLVWVVLDIGTVDAEVRKVTVSGSTISWTGGLTYSHATLDEVRFISSPVLNVKWFGAIGDGIVDDALAIQRAFNQNLSGVVARATRYYFPFGTYRVNTSLNLTNAQDFYIQGDSWENTKIVGHCTGRAVFDLLGSRFFVFQDITVDGDDINTPACAFFGARTITGPNCSNFEFSRVNVTNSFAVAGWYFVSCENLRLDLCRAHQLSTPYVYKSYIANDDAVVSDYETIDAGPTGATVHRFRDCIFGTDGNTNNSGILLERGHGSIIDGCYITAYGTGNAAIRLEGQTNFIRIQNVTKEGTAETILHLAADADVRGLNFSDSGSSAKLITTSTGAWIRQGYISRLQSTAGGSLSVMDFDSVEDTHISNCWVNSTHTYTVADDFLRNEVWLPSGVSVIPTPGNLNAYNVYRVQGGSNRGQYMGPAYVLDMNNNELRNPDSGTTGTRPSAPTTGQTFYDTNLAQPIWWSGAAWVDADGNTV